MEHLGQLRLTQDSLVPRGITGWFQRLLKIYRAYGSALPNSATFDAQQDSRPVNKQAI
jgi:hypothetical protein